MSQRKQDSPFENRPLPRPPMGPQEPKEEPGLLFNDRYSYFKDEINKWKSSLKHGNNIFHEDPNNIVPSFAQQDDDQNRPHSNVPYKNILEEIESGSKKKEHTNLNNNVQHQNQAQRQNQSPSHKEFQKSYNSKQSHTDKHCERHNDSKSKNYNSMTNKENIKPFNEIQNKNVQKPNKNLPQETKPKKINIPKNLNIKEEQLGFFSDLTNVLTLFSELKGRIEKLTEDKVELATKNDLLQKNCEHLEKELKTQESNSSILSQKYKVLQTNDLNYQKENKFQKEHQNVVEEQNKELTEKNDFLQNENNIKQEQVKQMNIDISVLKNIMKEMVIKDNMTDYSGDNTYDDNSCKYSNENSHSFIMENPKNESILNLSPIGTVTNLCQSFGEKNCFT